MKAGFTLLEIMVACAVLAVLVAIALPATSKISEYNARTKSISNLRQIAVAARLYANDHNQQLPGQPPPETAAGGEQWPALLCSYLSPSNPAVFLDPGDEKASRLRLEDILSSQTNNTGYLYNGFDELGDNNRPPATVSLLFLPDQSNTVLLAQKKPGVSLFCLDPLFQSIANLLDLLNPGAYDGGSHYLFVDGSVRYVKQEDYSNKFWLVNKEFPLPLPPLPPLPRGAQDGTRYANQPDPAPWPLATIR